MTLSPATFDSPLLDGRLPPRRGGTLARVSHIRAGHFLFLQTPQNVGADGTDVLEPRIRHASPWGQGWAGAALIGCGAAITRAKSLPLLSFQAQVNHFAHSRHSAVGASESVRRMIHDARKFSAKSRKVIRNGGKHDG